MKRLLILTLVSAHVLTACSQSTEFTVYPNGLVYSDTTMLQLRHIVDSLNLTFRHCDLYKKYYSGEQGIAHTISLEGNDAPAAFHDIQQGISFADLIKKYKTAKVDSNLLITKEKIGMRRQPDRDFYSIHRPDDDNAPTSTCAMICRAPWRKTSIALWADRANGCTILPNPASNTLLPAYGPFILFAR